MITLTWQKPANHPKQAAEKQSPLPSSLIHHPSPIFHHPSSIFHLPRLLRLKMLIVHYSRLCRSYPLWVKNCSFFRAPARKYNNLCSFPRASVGASFAPKVYKYTKYTHPCVQSPLLARNNTKNTQFSSQIFAYIKKKQ